VFHLDTFDINEKLTNCLQSNALHRHFASHKSLTYVPCDVNTSDLIACHGSRSRMYTFGVCSIWHLAAVSVVKCTVIVRPLTHFTIFSNRILLAIICTVWTLSLTVGGAINAGVTELHFNWITMTSYAQHQSKFFRGAFSAVTFVIPSLIIMIAYTKVFLVVRRQVRSMPIGVLGSFGSRTIFGYSVRSAKNLFVIFSVQLLG